MWLQCVNDINIFYCFQFSFYVLFWCGFKLALTFLKLIKTISFASHVDWSYLNADTRSIWVFRSRVAICCYNEGRYTYDGVSIIFYTLVYIFAFENCYFDWDGVNCLSFFLPTASVLIFFQLICICNFINCFLLKKNSLGQILYFSPHLL